MRKWTKTAGLLFLAVSSVYTDRVVRAEIGLNTASAAAPEVKPIDNSDSAAAPATQPAKAADQSAKAADATASDLTSDKPSADKSSTDASAAAPSDKTSASDATAVADKAVTPDKSASSDAMAVDKPAGDKTVAAPKMTLNDSGTFSIQINNDISLVEVLRMIGNQAQISVIPSKEVRGTVPAMDLYNVTVKEALDAILHTNGYGYREKGNFIYVYSNKELAELDKAGRTLNTEVFHLYYTPAANAVNMIKPVLSPEAQVSFTTPPQIGIDGSGTKDTGGNSNAIEDVIVVTDLPDNLDKVRRVLKEIDRRPQQIMVEATILQATLSDNNALGVDFSVLGGVNFNQIVAPPGQAGLIASQGGLVNGASSGSGSSSGQSTGTGTGPGNSTGTGANRFTAANTAFPLPQGGLTIGAVYDNIAVFIAALEQVTNTTVLANPKVLTLDKQKGEVIVGRKDGYITTEVNSTSSTQTVEFLDTGTRLIFRPFIGDDGYIRMEIHPEDSSGGLNSANLPFKNTTEVTTNVMIKDGHTIVIGGLFRESSSTARGQVPFLGNIPLVGALFRQQADDTQRQEIIVLLTPHIIKDDSAFSDESEAELKNAEKLRVGVRKDMMPWGRERLAVTNYEWAVNELNKPNPDTDRALFFLNSATNLNPHFLEAIDLKERVTGREITDPDNSSIRGFVKRQILADKRREALTPAVPAPTNDGTKVTPDVTPKQSASALTAPTSQPVATGPATSQPTDAKADDSDLPAPVADGNNTAASEPNAQAVAEPTSQPSVADGNAQPSTQPSVADENAQPSTQPAVAKDDAKDDSAKQPEMIELPPVADAPATQPAAGQATAKSDDKSASDDKSGAKPDAVTDVPIEVPDDATPGQK